MPVSKRYFKHVITEEMLLALKTSTSARYDSAEAVEWWWCNG